MGDYDLGASFGPSAFTGGVGSFTVKNALPGELNSDAAFNTDFGMVRIDDSVTSVTLNVVHIGRDGINFSIGWITPVLPAAASIHPAAEIAWPTLPGVSYQVQTSLSLDNPNWTDFGSPVIGNGSEMSVFDSTRNKAKQFYRIITIP